MNDALFFLFRHGYSILFVGVLLSQAGLPVPVMPVLIVAGTLVGMGKMDFSLALGLALLASTISDLLRYYLGRLFGMRMVAFLCRVSLEPDSCVRRTEDLFGRHGATSLLYCKFIPGFNAVVASMAGILRMRLSRFLAFNTLGALLWAASFIGVGYIFSDVLDDILEYAGHMGRAFSWLLVAVLALYVAWKYFHRRRFIQQLSIDRITPGELKARLDVGEDITVIDLRSSLDFEADPYMIPGAIRMAPEHLEHKEVASHDREVVLYCT
jgi:membrane protein DedA with SNARE-associated domain